MSPFTQEPHKMTETEFVNIFGDVYEHSTWIARQTWTLGLKDSDNHAVALSQLMSAVVEGATSQQQLDLILAHPDLAGKAAQSGQLTAESSSEQSGAGIDQCNAEEFEHFRSLNKAYKRKFKFPFIMAVKGSNRHKILESFERRLPNSYDVEFREALDQIHKIALFRLEQIFLIG